MLNMEDWKITPDDDLNPEELKQRVKYREMDADLLMGIKPKWAINIDEMYDKSGHPESGKYQFFECDVNKLIANADNLDLKFEKSLNGSWSDELRFLTTLDLWASGKPVDPPTISNEHSGKYSISDGRHRTVLSQYLGDKCIIISVPLFVSMR